MSESSTAVTRKAKKSPEAFRTISEVSEELDIPQHVLRFWETKFSMVKPLKRGGGRRYYRPSDIEIIKGIRDLLYTHGFTIKGAQKLLKEQGGRLDNLDVLTGGKSQEETKAAPKEVSVPTIEEPTTEALQDKEVLREILDELQAIRKLLPR